MSVLKGLSKYAVATLLKVIVGAKFLDEEWQPVRKKSTNSTVNVLLCGIVVWRDTVNLRHHKGLNVKSLRVSLSVPKTAIKARDPSPEQPFRIEMQTKDAIRKASTKTFWCTLAGI